MSQRSDALGHRPDPREPQGIDRQAAQGGQDLPGYPELPGASVKNDQNLAQVP